MSKSELGPRELLIRVHAAGLKPGRLQDPPGSVAPGLHKDLSGTVVARGPGTARFAEGERVFARAAKETMGAFAE